MQTKATLSNAKAERGANAIDDHTYYLKKDNDILFPEGQFSFSKGERKRMGFEPTYNTLSFRVIKQEKIIIGKVLLPNLLINHGAQNWTVV